MLGEPARADRADGLREMVGAAVRQIVAVELIGLAALRWRYFETSFAVSLLHITLGGGVIAGGHPGTESGGILTLALRDVLAGGLRMPIGLLRQWREIIADPAVRTRLRNVGFDAFSSTPDELAAYLRADLAKWSAILKNSGVKPE